MRHKWTLLLLIISFVFISGCISQTSVSESFVSSNNNFGFKIFKELSKNESGNMFISPSSINLAFYMLYNGAVGETKEAMAKTLEIQGISVEKLNEESKNFISILKNTEPKVEISIANSIWTRMGFRPLPEFTQTNQKYYGASVRELDFSSPEAVNTINGWVNENTKGKIKYILQSIPPEALMYLLNAIYFKGTWTTEFDKKLTQDREFTLANGEKKTHPMMKQEGNFSYMETDDFQAVNLSYGNNESFSMYVFLPKNGLGKFLQNLNSTSWNDWMGEFSNKEGTLIMPKFKMEWEKELNDVLKTLGMEIAFTRNANFGKVVKGGGIFISLVKHKTFVEVNEEGTEAAAVTIIEIAMGIDGGRPRPQRFYMEVNRPFFFAIVDNKIKSILFMGIVQNPSL